MYIVLSRLWKRSLALFLPEKETFSRSEWIIESKRDICWRIKNIASHLDAKERTGLGSDDVTSSGWREKKRPEHWVEFLASIRPGYHGWAASIVACKTSSNGSTFAGEVVGLETITACMIDRNKEPTATFVRISRNLVHPSFHRGRGIAYPQSRIDS